MLGGTEDILSGVEPVRALATALGAELRLLDDCGHYPWVEQPDLFRLNVARRLTQLDPWTPVRQS
ncbi:alpha/beta fold hydrolase [Cellulomonas bogoriensis]|uniref:Alpha/beta hydrolase n=1 Tax=Cellulomonas bogoriensis 69B4 = DSM 16987 TaxID=1386082 RepID=A0A0A0C356_9CELL|nr:alpha/beta hydrolase [Cellulomonas bogoriensis]KGM13759.1 hypothetical protein N869_10450 [Cellulomonas bogoriensis 69B4 = DSM 16987]